MPSATLRHRYCRWYSLSIWRGNNGLRAQQLTRQPLCERCKAAGRITVATIVNHRQSHKGDWVLFIDPENHESVCKDHHDALIQKEEARGHVIGNGLDAGRSIHRTHGTQFVKITPVVSECNSKRPIFGAPSPKNSEYGGRGRAKLECLPILDPRRTGRNC